MAKSKYTDDQLLEIAREYARSHYGILGGKRSWDNWARERGYPSYTLISKRIGSMAKVATLIGAYSYGAAAARRGRIEARKFLAWLEEQHSGRGER